MFEIGDQVRILPPFDQFFPGTWVISGIDAETGAYQINGGNDFDSKFLEKIV